MRIAALTAALALIAAGPASAQQASTCVDVQIGSDRHYACLNGLLRQSVPQPRASAADTPWSAATTPSYAVGGFNQQATRQMLGTNFGRSVVPQRPAESLPASPFARGAR